LPLATVGALAARLILPALPVDCFELVASLQRAVPARALRLAQSYPRAGRVKPGGRRFSIHEMRPMDSRWSRTASAQKRTQLERLQDFSASRCLSAVRKLFWS